MERRWTYRTSAVPAPASQGLLCAGWVFVLVLLFLALGLPARAASPFVETASRVRPAVVNIRCIRSVTDQGVGTGPLQEMYRRFFPDQEGKGGRFEMPSTGSGFVVDPAGYILTNDHVIAEAEAVFVRFTGEHREYPAEVVGADPGTDFVGFGLSLPIPFSYDARWKSEARSQQQLARAAELSADPVDVRRRSKHRARGERAGLGVWRWIDQQDRYALGVDAFEEWKAGGISRDLDPPAGVVRAIGHEDSRPRATREGRSARTGLERPGIPEHSSICVGDTRECLPGPVRPVSFAETGEDPIESRVHSGGVVVCGSSRPRAGTKRWSVRSVNFLASLSEEPLEVLRILAVVFCFLLPLMASTGARTRSADAARVSPA